MTNQSQPLRENRPYWVNNPTAQRLFEAYQRIVGGDPKRVAKSARLTLSSVAMEAGFQRSTLSRKRFPDLCELIEQSKPSNQKRGKTMHEQFKAKQRAARNLRVRLEEERERNSVLTNQLASLTSKFIKMAMELDETKRRLAPKVVVALSRE